MSSKKLVCSLILMLALSTCMFLETPRAEGGRPRQRKKVSPVGKRAHKVTKSTSLTVVDAMYAADAVESQALKEIRKKARTWGNPEFKRLTEAFLQIRSRAIGSDFSLTPKDILTLSNTWSSESMRKMMQVLEQTRYLLERAERAGRRLSPKDAYEKALREFGIDPKAAESCGA